MAETYVYVVKEIRVSYSLSLNDYIKTTFPMYCEMLATPVQMLVNANI